ncbi:MAG: imidazole glycerol phosphate synthase subunit HisH [Cytophagales bacterium]|nr:MAG: imidazole glycerol phosphate synthase subunit HisH [Cytophagales bacterium]
MKIAIIQYNAGNTQSVIYALSRLGINPILSDHPETIQNADKVIFPGVGNAAPAMQHLKKNNLDQLIPTLKQPFLGICLGMQLLCEHSEEENTQGLGIFPISVKKFNPTQSNLKVPHMGWNTLQTNPDSPLFRNLNPDPYFYFVHSYFVPKQEYTSATCQYDIPFSAAIEKDNFYAVQFHPEKSSKTGETLLQNFLTI